MVKKFKRYSVDSGSLGTNAVMGGKDFYVPSARAAVQGNQLDMAILQKDVEWVEWFGQRYYVGEDVLNVLGGSAEHHQGQARYGNEFQKFLAAYACAKLGAGLKGSTEIELITYTPPGFYNKAHKAIKASFLENDGETSILLKGETKPRKWRYTNCRVYPEGLSAVAALMFDHNAEPKYEQWFEGNVAIFDGGVFTLDVIVFQDGEFSPESLKHATWERDGLRKHVFTPIMEWVKSHGGAFATVTIDHIDKAFRDPEKKLRLTSKIVIELAEVFDRYGNQYAQWFANNVIDSLDMLDQLRSFSLAACVGGWSDLVEPHLRSWYGEVIFDRWQHPFAKKVHPVYWNAYGGPILAQLETRV